MKENNNYTGTKIDYYENGNIMYKQNYLNGKEHGEYTWYCMDGNIWYKYYCKDGYDIYKKHRNNCEFYI